MVQQASIRVHIQGNDHSVHKRHPTCSLVVQPQPGPTSTPCTLLRSDQSHCYMMCRNGTQRRSGIGGTTCYESSLTWSDPYAPCCNLPSDRGLAPSPATAAAAAAPEPCLLLRFLGAGRPPGGAAFSSPEAGRGRLALGLTCSSALTLAKPPARERSARMPVACSPRFCTTTHSLRGQQREGEEANA